MQKSNRGTSAPSTPAQSGPGPQPGRTVKFAVVIATALAGLALYHVAFSSTTPSTPPVTVPRVATTTPTPDPGPTTPTISSIPPATPGTTQPAPGVFTNGAQVPIPLADGSYQTVPAEALAVARAATVALFTQNYATVAMAPGVQPPTGLTAFPSPVVTNPILAGPGTGGMAISFLVVPAAGTTPRRITVNVLPIAGHWAWQGA